MNSRDTSGQNSKPASQTAQTQESSRTMAYSQAPEGLDLAIRPPLMTMASPAIR
ncbi:hypothetical protein D9M68_998680 [compost metagenome]